MTLKKNEQFLLETIPPAAPTISIGNTEIIHSWVSSVFIWIPSEEVISVLLPQRMH